MKMDSQSQTDNEYDRPLNKGLAYQPCKRQRIYQKEDFAEPTGEANERLTKK